MRLKITRRKNVLLTGACGRLSAICEGGNNEGAKQQRKLTWFWCLVSSLFNHLSRFASGCDGVASGYKPGQQPNVAWNAALKWLRLL